MKIFGYLLWKTFIYMFCKILRNFVNSVTEHDCHDYIGQIQNQFKNVHRSCKTFTANVHLVKDYNMNIIKSGSYQPGFWKILRDSIDCLHTFMSFDILYIKYLVVSCTYLSDIITAVKSHYRANKTSKYFV